MSYSRPTASVKIFRVLNIFMGDDILGSSYLKHLDVCDFMKVRSLLILSMSFLFSTMSLKTLNLSLSSLLLGFMNYLCSLLWISCILASMLSTFFLCSYFSSYYIVGSCPYFCDYYYPFWLFELPFYSWADISCCFLYFSRKIRCSKYISFCWSSQDTFLSCYRFYSAAVESGSLKLSSIAILTLFISFKYITHFSNNKKNSNAELSHPLSHFSYLLRKSNTRF